MASTLAIRGADGKPDNCFSFSCEGIAPERIIQIFEFEGLPEKGHVALETCRFEALPNNRTRMMNQTLFQSVMDRDGMVASGMEGGMKV